MNKELLIKDLKELAKKRDQQAIIAFSIERDGTVRCVTYGENKLKCAAVGWWGQGLFKATQLSKVPFQTVFGVGNNGEPMPLKNTEMMEVAGKVPNKFL